MSEHFWPMQSEHGSQGADSQVEAALSALLAYCHP
jgi:hypothetical protein